LFETATLAGLAQRIEEARSATHGLVVPPIVAVPRDRDLPLSFSQQRLWVLDHLESNSAFYNMPMLLRFGGILDVEALKKSLNEIVQRHETLRTTFASKDEQLIQVIAPSLRVELPLTDLTDIAPEEREATARRLASQEAQRPFDLRAGPLFRAALLRLGADDHVLLLNMHHIVSDGWSVGVLINELSWLYESFTQAKASPLAPLSLQYADYAVWQRNWLQGETLDQHLAYWKGHLEGAPALLELPTDRPRPPIETFRGEVTSIQIASDLTQRLKRLSRQENVTLYMTLLAGYGVLLSRYSGQEDVVVGTPIANRNRAEIENVIGFFANTLPLRCSLAGDPSFHDLLRRVREVALGAYAHQDLPFEKVVEALRPERSLGYNPIFQVIFALQNQPRPQRDFAGLTSRPFGAKTAIAKMDLSLYLFERGDALSGIFEYNTDLFDQSTIERLGQHFQQVLEAIVENPGLRVSEIPLPGQEERRQVLVEWNRTEAEYARDRCVHQLLEAQAERTPDRVAVAFDDHSFTYRELNARANQLAHALGKMGVAPGQRVGVFIERSLEMMVALVGVLKAGAAYVPLDPDYPSERVRLTLADPPAPL